MPQATDLHGEYGIMLGMRVSVKQSLRSSSLLAWSPLMLKFNLPVMLILWVIACGGDEPLAPVAPAGQTKDQGALRDMASGDFDSAVLVPVTRAPVPGPDAPVCSGPLMLGSPLCAAGYFGAPGDQRVWRGVILEGGGGVLAMNLPGVPQFGPEPKAFFEEPGTGTLIRLAPDAKTIIKWAGVGQDVQRVARFAAAADGVVASGTFGMASFTGTLDALRWQAQGGAATEVATGLRAGKVAVLVGASLVVFDAQGASLGFFSIQSPGITPTRVAFDDQLDLVVVTGYIRQSRGRESALLRAYTLKGALVWERFAPASDEFTGKTQGQHVKMGQDGWLYYVGVGDAAQSPHTEGAPESFVARLDPFESTTSKDVGRKATFLARLDPQTGRTLAARYVVARDAAGGLGQVKVKDVAIHESGQIYLLGTTACCGPDEKEGAFIAKLSPSMATLGWETVGPVASVTPESVDAWGSRVMALYTVSQEGLPVYDGIYPELQGGADVYIQVFEHGKTP